MRELEGELWLKDQLQHKALLTAFLRKFIFDGGEVNYLTILHEGRYNVYWSNDAVSVMADNFEVVNFHARIEKEYDSQKLLFRYKGKNVGNWNEKRFSTTLQRGTVQYAENSCYGIAS